MSIVEIDKLVFEWINRDLSNVLFDAVLPWCRERWFWAPLYGFILAFGFVNFGRKAWQLLFGMLVVLALADFTSSTLIKKQVQRLRPCNDPTMTEIVRTRVHCGSGYSFTSSHAANHFGIALFLIGIFGAYGRWIKPALLLWAGTVAFSQVYVGVHYPGDVLAGGLLGAAIGWSVFRLGRKLGWFSWRFGDTAAL